MNDYKDWLGRSRQTESSLDPWPSQALHASIESPAPVPQVSLPMLWHWLYFLETGQRSDQGHDGHPRKGDFYPPITNPRRMFVGGRSEVLQPLQLGRPAQLVERIHSCEQKQGGAGTMTLLSVAYDYSQGGQLCVREQRDFMYLPARDGAESSAAAGTVQPVPDAPYAWDVATDPVLLFKFSALTFNGHRIHYDADYARQAEGYPGLVVHGPLTAMLLAELARSALGGPLTAFSFRARAPLFAGDLLRLRAVAGETGMMLTAYRPDGTKALTAEAQS